MPTDEHINSNYNKFANLVENLCDPNNIGFFPNHIQVTEKNLYGEQLANKLKNHDAKQLLEALSKFLNNMNKVKDAYSSKREDSDSEELKQALRDAHQSQEIFMSRFEQFPVGSVDRGTRNNVISVSFHAGKCLSEIEKKVLDQENEMGPKMK